MKDMTPFSSTVRAELMTSLPVEAPLLIQNIKSPRARPTKDSLRSPWSGSNTADFSDVKSHNVSSVTEGHFLPFLAKDRSTMTNCTSDNNVFDNDISGRHFLFDKRWRNGIYLKNDFGGDVLIKQNSTMPLPFPEFHVNQSHNLTRFAHRKEFPLGNPQPLVFGAGDYFTSFPSVLLPATTPSVTERLCLSQNYKDRSRMKNKARNLFSTDAKNKKIQSYPDPLLGATSSLVQRLTEISSLEVETVRQEKIKRLKKINRQDS